MDRTSYDSTWEEDESSAEEEWSTNKVKDQKYTQARETTRQLKNGKPKKFRYEYMYSTAARDMQDYRHGYQRRWANYQGDPEEMPNLHFYRNEIKFKPNGFYIEEILKTWKENYAMLERNHNYIQWLFPLQERGVNPHASPLCEDEVKIMKNDRDVTRRLLQAYKLMLGFYGLYLKNEETGEVCRARNWMERYKNLNNNTHNNLRITRILKCLGELGFEHYQAPLVQFFLKETLCKDQLKNTKRSVLDYFMFSVKDKRERQNLVCFAWKYYKPQSMFVWGPEELLRRYQDVLKEYQGEDCDTIRREHGKEDKKEPQNKNNEDDGKENKRKEHCDREDDELNMKNKNGQGGIQERGEVETLYPNSIGNGGATIAYKMEDSQEENLKSGEENSQHGMREHAEMETQTNDKPQRNDSEDDRTKLERKKRKDNHIHGQQYMKNDEQAESPHHKKPQSIDNRDDRRAYTMEDRKEDNVKRGEGNSQHGMREHEKIETQTNDKPRRNDGGDDRTKFKRENREDNPIHGQQYMKNGKAETLYHKNPQRKNNSGGRKKSKMWWKKTKIGSEKKNSQHDIKPQGERDVPSKNHVNNEKHVVLSGDKRRKRATNLFCIPIPKK